MPEGPEVRTVTDQLSPLITGHILFAIIPLPERSARVTGVMPGAQIIVRVSCRGKKLVLELGDGTRVVISLLVSGRIRIDPGPNQYIQLICSWGVISLDDPRQLGQIRIYEPSRRTPVVGLDLLTNILSPFDWLALLKPRRATTRVVCQLLLDQTKISGIGNYLKCDILYTARIHPHRPVKHLTNDEWERLRVATYTLIHESYRNGGLTTRNFTPPDGAIGRYQARVYQQEIAPNGMRVGYLRSPDGRGTYWVAGYQI